MLMCSGTFVCTSKMAFVFSVQQIFRVTYNFCGMLSIVAEKNLDLYIAYSKGVSMG